MKTKAGDRMILIKGRSRVDTRQMGLRPAETSPARTSRAGRDCTEHYWPSAPYALAGAVGDAHALVLSREGGPTAKCLSYGEVFGTCFGRPQTRRQGVRLANRRSLVLSIDSSVCVSCSSLLVVFQSFSKLRRCSPGLSPFRFTICSTVR